MRVRRSYRGIRERVDSPGWQGEIVFDPQWVAVGGLAVATSLRVASPVAGYFVTSAHSFRPPLAGWRPGPRGAVWVTQWRDRTERESDRFPGLPFRVPVA